MDLEHSYIFPKFGELPRIPNTPQGCLWGFYGKKDEVGAINLLTPSVKREASKEIQTGHHVQLDWPLHHQEFSGYNRKSFEHKIIDHKPLGICGFDDEVHMNTQSGSRWDGLKHNRYGNGRNVFYNGLTYEKASRSTTNGTHNWCERGAIIGRGILVDMVRFYERRHRRAPDPWTRHEIPLEDLQTTLEDQSRRPGRGTPS